jgi:hypothetical protein
VRRTLELAQDWVEGSCAGRASTSVVVASLGGSALTQHRTKLNYCRVCRVVTGQAASTLTGNLAKCPAVHTARCLVTPATESLRSRVLPISIIGAQL